MGKEKPQEDGSLAGLREEIRELRKELDEVKTRLQALEEQEPTQGEGKISELTDKIHEETGRAVEAVENNRMPTFKELCERKETAIQLTHDLLAIPTEGLGRYKEGYFIIPNTDSEGYGSMRDLDKKFVEKFYSGFIDEDSRRSTSWGHVISNYNITEVAWTDVDCSTVKDAEKISEHYIKQGKLEPNDRLKSYHWKPPRKSASELFAQSQNQSGCIHSQGCILVPVVDKPPYCMENDSYRVDDYYYVIPNLDPRQIAGTNMNSFGRWFRFNRDLDYTNASLFEFTQAGAIMVTHGQTEINLSKIDMLSICYLGEARLKNPSFPPR